MTSDSLLPAHLDRVGQQLTAAARRHHAAQRRSRRRRAGVLACLTALAAIVLVSSIGSAPPPAYALTRHEDGSITITLSQLTTGIPALNARLHALGIDETVIPIRAGCHSRDGSGAIVMHPDPRFEYDGAISTTYTPRAQQQHPPPPGFHYVLAAKRLPNGKILGFIGALRAPVPTCLPFSPSRS